MADSLAIVASCMSLLEAISKVSDDVKAFAIDISGARMEMETLSREFNDLVPLIHKVKDRCGVNSIGANLPGNIMQEISHDLYACLQVVVRLQVLLRKVSSSKMKWMKWSVSTKGEAEKQRRSIQAHRTALATALALYPLSIAADVGQKLDNIISDMSGTTLSGDRDANLTRYSENEATSSVRIGMVVHELPAPARDSRTSITSSTAQSAQSTEKINSSFSPSLSDGLASGRNSSVNSSRPFVKALISANRALASQSKLKLKNSKLAHMISATAPELEAIDLLLRTGADPNTCTNDGDSLLKLAATRDQYSVAQLLLKYGANSMKLDANGSSAAEEAFSRGHARTVHVLLKNAARLDFGYGRFGTCIQAAALGGHLELCTLVMTHGADVNVSDSGLYGSALQAGVVSRSMEVAQLLLDHGASVNVKGGFFGTCIRAAAEIEHLEMSQLLISNGADVNVVARAGETALLSAVTKENIGVCQVLLNAGAVITSSLMKTAWGLKGKKWEVLRLLAEHGGTVDDIDVPYFGTHLQSYASRSDTDKCKILLETCNADINANKGHYGTALQAAVSSQSRETVQLLLDHGADPNIMGGQLGSALQAAAACGRVDLCGMLIDAGADVNAAVGTTAEERKDIGEKGNCGRTALHVAASSGHESLIRLLLKKGSSIDTEDANGNTAMHLAVGNRHDIAVRLLLDNGANAAARDAHGNTALHLAATAGRESLVRLLLESGSDVNEKDSNGDIVLHLAARNGRNGVVRLLLEKGANVTTVDRYGRVALHEAAAGGHESLVELLLNKGSDINRKDFEEHVALDLAVMKGHDAVVKVLLLNGADLGSSGSAMLRAAIRTNHAALVEILLKKGADANATDAKGQTVLQLALLKGRGKIVQLLREQGARITSDPHFKIPRGRLPPSIDEDTWSAYTTDPRILAWD